MSGDSTTLTGCPLAGVFGGRFSSTQLVEGDLVRDVAVRLNAEPRVLAYVVEAENFESIHNHSAYALIERDKGSG